MTQTAPAPKSPRQVNPARQRRDCYLCDAEFTSTGNHHRMCAVCRARVAELDDGIPWAGGGSTVRRQAGEVA